MRGESLRACTLAVLVLQASIGVALAQSANPARGTPPPLVRSADVGDLEALAKFHARLAQFEADKTGKFAHLDVLQIGDSHTAADHFSGRLRDVLQARFGNGGRGFLPPGAPHAWYRPYQVSVTQSAGWKTLSSNKATPDAASYGLAGSVARASDAADVITIDIRDGARLRAFEVGVLEQPGGGALEISADGEPVAIIGTAVDAFGQLNFRFGVPPQTRRIELKPFGDGPVDVTGHSLIGEGRGISLSNLGFIGAQVSIMSRWHWPAVHEQIADLDPALVILAFGTNEGHAPVANIEARYARQLEDRVIALKAAAPNASIVLVGTPDANRYPKFCLPQAPAIAPEAALDEVPATDAGHTPGYASSPAPSSPAAAAKSKSRSTEKKPPPPEPPADAICQPLDAAERAGYERMMSDKDRRLCRWHTLPAIPVVRAIQREVAARQGALFFDWFEMFQSECGADRWYRQGLAAKDRVHFTRQGYAIAADKLYARLMAGYRQPKR